jgi:Uma2 family endonuclease
MIRTVRVMWMDAPEALLDERRRRGLDVRDEMWDGVLHVVPPPGGPHQGLSSEFFLVAGAIAKRRGLVPRMETGLFRAADDYRVPDQLYCRPEHLSDRGAEGAELVVEVRSPDDETYRKLPFYAALGVREVLVLHPAPRRAELYRLVEDQLLPVQADAAGELASDVLGVRVAVAGDVLRLSWAGGGADV